VKPNIMMFYSKDDMSVITEPGLVEHLIDKIAEKGYSNIAVVESQNVFGNWFDKREVETWQMWQGLDQKSTARQIPYSRPDNGCSGSCL